jgi:hypothetical protein
MAEETRLGTGGELASPGPFLAKVISHLDPTYMGMLEVQLLHEVGNDEAREGQLHQVKYLSPFIGQTSIDYVNEEEDNYNNTQKSYGFWMIPPDVGNTVMVMFVDGDPRKGYWIGCVQDTNMNFMMPGYAATYYNVDDTKATDKERVPVAEYNKIIGASTMNATKITKPATPFETALDNQGLLEDDIRGITTTSARREIPSMVFGISTPGPVDKQQGARTGSFGKAEHKIGKAFVSRLGGSSFVMDDGDDKFIRRTAATDGPPEYANVEDGDTAGEVTIPHNELIRIRTRTGHQILLHNSEDLIYIGNSRGTAWIELSSDGKIDIYAEDSISMHTKQDFNFYADRDINMEAGRNFNLKVADRHQTEVGGDLNLLIAGNKNVLIDGDVGITIGGDNKVNTSGNLDINTSGSTKISTSDNFDLKSGGNNKFTAGEGTDINSGGNHTETATKIHMNGPTAATAAAAESPTPPEPLPTFANPDETETVIDSIMLRIPSHEPWPHHENLDPTSFKPDMTDREAGSDIAVPETWKVYSTTTDTFQTIEAAEEPEE